ncbi:MAG: hypothetical protein CMJ18_03075 [Phycisphaeraceae bacterium]|nr:hypothetical protein [Phycisphaeraceae bacterium]
MGHRDIACFGLLAHGPFARPWADWQGVALVEADKLATDDINQLDYYREAGYFKNTPVPYADLGAIVTGMKPGREHAGERTICINLGIALDDMAVAILIYEKAKERGLGTRLPF